MVLGVVRALVVAAAVVVAAFAFMRRTAVKKAFCDFLFEPSSPLNVALLRIFVFGLVFRAACRTQAVWYAGLPVKMRHPPFGWGFLRESVLFEPDVVALVQRVVIVSSACAALGLFTRVSAPVAAFSLVAVHAVCTFFEKVNHGFHAPTLCALVLAFAPSGDALSLDRLVAAWRRRPAPVASAVYGIPLRACWVLLGTTYLFPGLWKLWFAGDLWISGDQLRFTLLGRWGHLGRFVPPFRLDEYPLLLALLGSGTLVFEIGFIFAVFQRKTRVLAAFAAFSFHYGVSKFMRIGFPLYLPFILLLDFPQLGELVRASLPERLVALLARIAGSVRALRTGFSLHARPPLRAPLLRSLRPPLVAGAVLISGQLATGVFALNTWPLSIFPTFAGRKNSVPPTGVMRFVHESRDGRQTDLRDSLERMGPARLRNLFQKLSAGRDQKRTGRLLVRLFERAGVTLAKGDRIAVYDARWDLFPLGKRSNYREKLVRGYEMAADGSLCVVEGREASKARDSRDTHEVRRRKRGERVARARRSRELSDVR